jgi:type I restriction enzyme S subunit
MTTVLDEIETRIGWKTVPLRAVGVKVSEVGFPNLEPLSVFLDAGVVPRSSREDNHNQLGESLEKYQRVLPHDLVFNKLRTWQGGFGISAYEGIVSPAYIIVRLNTEIIHPKFLWYLLKSELYLAELTRLSKWMPPTQFDISWENLRDLQLRIPPIEEQQRIADFLDFQMNVIHKIEELSRLLTKLTQEDFRNQNELLFAATGAPRIPLRRVGRLVTDKRNDLLPTVSLDLVQARRGTLNVSDLPITEGLTSTRMAKGDIAFGKLRPYLGKVYLAVDETFAESEFIVMRVDKNLLSQEYLSKYLLTQGVLNELESLSVGSKMPRTSWDQMASLMVPVPNLKIQQDICNQISSNESLANHKEKVLLRLSEKLGEFRKSIISSQITGTFERPLKWRK